MATKTLTVSELNTAIKALLEPSFSGICVQGEISNFKIQSSGHLYFALKDAGSQISAVLFKGNAASLSRMPKEGDQVIAKGELSLYLPRGQYQIIIRELQFLGLGELLLKLHQLKQVLEKRGWFDPIRKKKLPPFPKRIGIVTSPTGAVIQDILNVLTRRFSGFHLILNPVKVQGEGAAQEIAQAIREFNRYQLADVLIVGRGGGSIEDLWAFNEELVAAAIFESKIPVISAVGHETDVTIADFVADVRAPTPSAAAELAVAEKSNLLKWLEHSRQALQRKWIDRLERARQQIAALQKHPLLSSPYALLARPIQDTDAMRSSLDLAIRRHLEHKSLQLQSAKRRLALLNPKAQTEQLRIRLKPYAERLLVSWKQTINARRERLKSITAHLASLNPKNLLQKGYSLLYQQGAVIRSARQLAEGESLTAWLFDGKVETTIKTIEISNESKPIV